MINASDAKEILSKPTRNVFLALKTVSRVLQELNVLSAKVAFTLIIDTLVSRYVETVEDSLFLVMTETT